MTQLMYKLDHELRDEKQALINYINERLGDTWTNSEGKNIVDRLLDLQTEITKREGA